MEPLNLNVFFLILQKSVSSSPVGSPSAIAQMLEFCQRHNIKPITQHFPLSEVNEAMDHLKSGKARYRVVLDVMNNEQLIIKKRITHDSLLLTPYS